MVILTAWFSGAWPERYRCVALCPGRGGAAHPHFHAAQGIVQAMTVQYIYIYIYIYILYIYIYIIYIYISLLVQRFGLRPFFLFLLYIYIYIYMAQATKYRPWHSVVWVLNLVAYTIQYICIHVFSLGYLPCSQALRPWMYSRVVAHLWVLWESSHRRSSPQYVVVSIVAPIHLHIRIHIHISEYTIYI